MQTRIPLALAALALVAGCGGASTDQPPAKPESLPLTEIAAGAGGAAPDERVLDVQLTAPSPIGLLTADRAGAYLVRLRLANRGDRPIPLDPLSIQLSVFERTDPVAGCDRVEPRRVHAPAVLQPGSALTLPLPLGCALPDAGTYRVVAVAIVGEEGPGAAAPEALLRSGSTSIVVDPALPPFAP